MRKYSKIEVEGLQILARLSLAPNSRGYCGRGSAGEKFVTCITQGQCSGLKSEFKHFMVLYPYLRTLEKITGKSRFSLPVAQAYWFGHPVLKKAKPHHYELLLDYFLKQGASESFVEELRKNPPKRFIPFHLFQILHIAVKTTGGTKKQKLASANNCMVRWGKVLSTGTGKATVALTSLGYGKNGAYLLTLSEEMCDFDSALTPGIKKGTVVAVHWGWILKILNPEEIKNLEYWTKEVIDTIKAA